MDDLPLSGLTPGDPRNRLSTEARQRLLRAHLECDRIRWEALANAEARQLSDAKEKYALNQANLKAARSVLKVLSKEYDDAGLTLREFWDAMKLEIEGVATSFELYDSQRRLLETEFFVPQQKPVSAKTPAAVSRPSAIPQVVPKPETVGAQVRHLREECHLTVEELAPKVGLEPRSVQRHEADKAVPYARHIRAYEREFSKLLNRRVVISKLS
jgi:DNA-binding XRE family transcriptional regulator